MFSKYGVTLLRDEINSLQAMLTEHYYPLTEEAKKNLNNHADDYAVNQDAKSLHQKCVSEASNLSAYVEDFGMSIHIIERELQCVDANEELTDEGAHKTISLELRNLNRAARSAYADSVSFRELVEELGKIIEEPFRQKLSEVSQNLTKLNAHEASEAFDDLVSELGELVKKLGEMTEKPFQKKLSETSQNLVRYTTSFKLNIGNFIAAARFHRG